MQVRFVVFQWCVSILTAYCVIDCFLRSASVIYINNSNFLWKNSVFSDNTTNMYRPRGALARAMYNKQLSDERLQKLNHSQWYHVDLDELHPKVRKLFVPSSLDPETQHFLDHCNEKSDQVLTQLWHSIVKTFLKLFMTQTDINGLLGRGSMFVFSKEKIGNLLNLPNGEYGVLIDLGAGDGLITKNLANFYSQTYVTEVSKTMRWTLKNRGFRVLEIDGWWKKQYDAVSCLNLLDRCEEPLSILQEIKYTLKPGGKVIFALVLPIHQYVESRQPDHQPIEWLPIQGNTFEEQSNSFINDVLHPAGFVVEKWTRLPYLCEGDMFQAYYWLDDAVFIARLKS